MSRESMDEMLQRVRDYVFQTDQALKESQRHICRDGAGQLETSALKEIRDDIWALEDKVRAAKWATSAAEQAEIANQIDPLMLQVLEKCQQRKDQVLACQGLLSDIVNWCERGTRAYRFAVHESAATKGPSRYSSSGGGSDNGVQVKAVPSRIPTYKSPTKVPKGQQQQQAAQAAQQQQLTQIKAHSRIPQPQVTRKSLPDAEQAGSSCDQTPERERTSSSGGASAASTTQPDADAGKAVPGTTAHARIAAFQRGAAPAAAYSNSSSTAVRSGGLVAAAAAAFEGGAPQGSVAVGARAPSSRTSTSSSGGGAAAAAAGAAAGTAAPVAKPTMGVCPPGHRASSSGGSSLVSKPLESFVPLDLDDTDEDLLQPTAPSQAQQQQAQQQQQAGAAAAARERLGHSGGSSSLMARGSGGRMHKSLLQLEPSRDDVPLTSAAHQSSAAGAAAAAAAADTAVPAASHAAPGSLTAGSTSHNGALRLYGALNSDNQGRSLQLKVPRPSYGSDAAGADPASSAGHFPEFGPLPSFTPLVSQHAGRSHPFGSSSNNGFADRGSLRTSQDISLLLRSGMLMEAALLSSNASRMHVIHDAVAKKPAKPEGKPEVPVVPSRLAVHKKRPWWAQAARVVVGTAAMAVAGAAGAAVSKVHQGGDAPAEGQSGSGRVKGSKHQQDHQQPLEEAAHALPFVPLGPAPDASAGCG